MGRPGMAEKQRNSVTQGGRRRRVRRSNPSESGSVVAPLPGWRVHQGVGQKRLPRPKPVWPENGSKRPSSGFHRFWGIFVGFWS